MISVVLAVAILCGVAALAGHTGVWRDFNDPRYTGVITSCGATVVSKPISACSRLTPIHPLNRDYIVSVLNTITHRTSSVSGYYIQIGDCFVGLSWHCHHPCLRGSGCVDDSIIDL